MGVALLGLAFPASASAAIIGDVVSAGFNARGAALGSGWVVRAGVWAPIVVRLTLEGQTQFNGTLRVRQRDRDGDVCYDYHDVLLNADSRATQEYTLYTLPTVGPDGRVFIEVELLNDDDEIVKMVSGGELASSIRPADAPTVLRDDEYLILEISTGQMGKIARLADRQQKFHPLRGMNVAHLAPGGIPERWQGLEAVDCVVWDEADPNAITNNADARLHALAEWTRQGGLLVLATARHAAALQKTEALGPLLPVKVAALTTLKEAARFRDDWLDLPAEEPEYAEPIPLAECSLRKGAGIRRVFPVPGLERKSPNLDTLIARGRVGRGALVFIAASLRDLIDPKCDPSKFFRSVLEIRTTASEVYPEEPLYKPLEQRIGFTAIGSIYLVFAMLFAMAYVGLSTFGSWGFLKARGWERHNWTVFALLAAVASVGGIAAAQTIRGVGQKLNQLTIVDAIAGEPGATAIAYLGLKTGTHSILDVWLAENYAQRPEPQKTDCFLRPLPASPTSRDSGQTFADQRTYDLRPATAELRGVPLRATLKQFEGRWRGDLRGSIDASVRITERAFPRSETDSDVIEEPCFDNASTITNKLGVNLEDCFLFQPTVNRYRGTVDVSPRSGGERQARYETLVHYLGTIEDGATVPLATRLYFEPDGTRRTWDQWHTSLLDWQNRWGKFAKAALGGGRDDSKIRAGRQERYQEALLLLTALSEYDESATTIKSVYTDQPILFSRERCRPLDLSDILTEDMVLLVGFAKEDPGPVSLCTRRSSPNRAYKRVIPDESCTVYRIIIPVENKSWNGN